MPHNKNKDDICRKITEIAPNSPLAKTIAAKGDILRKINGNVITDVLDYAFHECDSKMLIELSGEDGKVKIIRLTKPEGTVLGASFEKPLMDNRQSCRNNCIFCFIDQLPEGMRDTLYYKDDDIRLSFLEGNYVTLTNLREDDIRRLIKLRISPVNISVHTLNPQLKELMHGREFGNTARDPIKHLKTLAKAGIILNCQIVCCPGVNDKYELTKTIQGLIKLGNAINSVSVVPVGLTKHREGLFPLRPFTRNLARQTVRKVEHYGAVCREKRGKPVFYASDELYMLAGKNLPPEKYYDDYPQLENGVGMMRLFITQFTDALRKQVQKEKKPVIQKINSGISEKTHQPVAAACNNENKTICSIATGMLAVPYITKLVETAAAKCDTIGTCNVYPVINNFFGKSITVSGLVTGKDLIDTLKDKQLGSRLLIPQNMLRRGSNVFLDDITTDDVSAALGIPVRIVRQNGEQLLKELMEN